MNNNAEVESNLYSTTVHEYKFYTSSILLPWDFILLSCYISEGNIVLTCTLLHYIYRTAVARDYKLVFSCFNHFENYILHDVCDYEITYGQTQDDQDSSASWHNVTHECHKTQHPASAATRQLNVPSGMQRVSVVFCWVLARIELGTANWTGGTSVFLCTRCPAWQETAWQTLMCFPGSVTDTSGVTGLISTSTKNVAAPFIFHSALCDGPSYNVQGREKPVEGKGERRMRRERRKRSDGQSSFLWWSGRWWEEERCWFILREKTSCWYRWHQDLFFPLLLPLFLSIHPSL